MGHFPKFSLGGGLQIKLKKFQGLSK